MGEQEENRELLYVIRSLEVMMDAGIGLESAIASIARGGYGEISADFSDMLKNVTNKGKSLEVELRRLSTKAKSDGYKRLLSTMLNNLTSNTDIIKTLRGQSEREEEKRTEKVSKYIEELGGMPETLLSLGMIAPIILAILGLMPQLMGDVGGFISIPDADVIASVVNMGLLMTVVFMAMVGLKAHTKDPGL